MNLFKKTQKNIWNIRNVFLYLCSTKSKEKSMRNIQKNMPISFGKNHPYEGISHRRHRYNF